MSVIKTQPISHLFALRQRVYAVSCQTCHPNTDRVVLLYGRLSTTDGPLVQALAARYIDGHYYPAANDRDKVRPPFYPIDPATTVWMESPHSEGPYYVANVTMNVILKDRHFTDIEKATEEVNNLNMGTFGNPTLTVVDQFGNMVDHEGYLTQYTISNNQ